MKFCNLYLKANLSRENQKTTAHNYSTRYNHFLNVPQNGLYRSDKNPVIMSTKFMNKLPLDIRLY